MAKHEFGIMPDAPAFGKRYDEYEPHRYSCIRVDDESLEQAAEKLQSVDCFWHTTDVPGKGLAYCGITLIPPSSLGAFLNVIRDDPDLSELAKLLEEAEKENRWVIHFGI